MHSYAGKYKTLVDQAIADGALYVYVCDGEVGDVTNLAADLDHLVVDPDVLRGVTLNVPPDYLGFEFSRQGAAAPLFGHAESPRSNSFHGAREFSDEIICRRTTGFTNKRCLAGVTADGGGMGLVVPAGFRIGVNADVNHCLLTTGNPHNQLSIGTGADALTLRHYVATWDGNQKTHSVYQNGVLKVAQILPSVAGIHDPSGPRGVAIGGVPGLGTQNADCVVDFYAIYPARVLTPEMIEAHFQSAGLEL